MTATTIAIPAKRGAARSEWLTLFRRLARRRTALFGLVVVALVFAAALGAPWLSPWDPIEQDITNRLKPPGSPDPSGRDPGGLRRLVMSDRKSTRLNSSHQIISYAVFCLKKKI